MTTFWIQTLGCKVNQYESEQIATLLRSRGLRQVDSLEQADLRIINSCSVTTEAASKSRQAVRRSLRLPLLDHASVDHAHANVRGRTIVTGCWATSNKSEATNLSSAELGDKRGDNHGDDLGDSYAVLTHNDDVAGELDRLLARWSDDESSNQSREPFSSICAQGSDRNDGLIMLRAGVPGMETPGHISPQDRLSVKNNFAPETAARGTAARGTRSLPLLDSRHTGHQRAFLKIQDGCDAHCSYCIIPRLRPVLWSKPIDDAVAEARNLVAAGHREIVLTGIFLGAFGQPTAIRKRQPIETARHFTRLIESLCTRVSGLRRLRLSSLEPLDLTTELIAALKSHQQIVPHFHLPLQSGSDPLLRRMNRQYTRDDFLRMIDRVNLAFDRPAITTDIIVGFPGECDREFDQTLAVVDRAKFIHIHAFPFSARPGTAAARWKKDFVDPRATKTFIQILTRRADACGFAYRKQFLGEEMEILVERNRVGPTQHGRCERYFDVHVEHDEALTGRAVRVKIERVSPTRTFASVQRVEP